MTRSPFRPLGRAAVIVFVLWHMTAVLLYALPWDAKDSFTAEVRKNLTPLTHWYVLPLSQWQQWNLFSPDPLRRVSHFLVQYELDGEWVTVADVYPGLYPSSRHATYFKLYGEFLDETERYQPIRDYYLQRHCVSAHLLPGTPIRLMRSFYILPYLTDNQSIAWWRAWEREEEQSVVAAVACPSEDVLQTLTPPPVS